jgi:hypothetical protein
MGTWLLMLIFSSLFLFALFVVILVLLLRKKPKKNIGTVTQKTVLTTPAVPEKEEKDSGHGGTPTTNTVPSTDTHVADASHAHNTHTKDDGHGHDKAHGHGGHGKTLFAKIMTGLVIIFVILMAYLSIDFQSIASTLPKVSGISVVHIQEWLIWAWNATPKWIAFCLLVVLAFFMPEKTTGQKVIGILLTTGIMIGVVYGATYLMFNKTPIEVAEGVYEFFTKPSPPRQPLSYRQSPTSQVKNVEWEWRNADGTIPMGIYSKSASANRGCRIDFDSGHGKDYQIFYRNNSEEWVEHYPNTLVDMSEFRFSVLKYGLREIVYTVTCS